MVTPFEDIALMHNRLTHSEKVAQVARSIAEQLLQQQPSQRLIAHLGGIDADVVETAALAHDLGHPPFGHIGELTLDEIARGGDPKIRDGFNGLGLADGFEGNAQTFRIVLLNETRHPDYDGLDLTSASLVAIAKYPWMRDSTLREDHKESLRSNRNYRRRWGKFSVYRPEWQAFESAREFLTRSGIGEDFPKETQSIEASIMDAADDITYAIHDLEDFYLAGVLDVRAVLDELDSVGMDDSLLGKLQARLDLDYSGYFDKELFEDAVTRVKDELFSHFSPHYEGDLDKIGRARSAGSNLIGRYINTVKISDEVAWNNGPFVALEQEEWHEVQILKEITKNFVIQRPDIALLQRGQQRILRELVTYLFEWKQSVDDFKRLPRRLREEIEIARDQREGGARRLARGYVKQANRDRPFAPRGHENRCILDYLCSLTDGQCYSLYYKLSGARPAMSAMDFFA